MSSILTNASALSALQSLTQTQSALSSTEKQVSSGLAVATAADNASYWSIAAQLNSDSGVVTASNQALSQSQAVLSTASSAIDSVTSTIAKIETALTQATNPGADLGAIETTLVGLSSQLASTVNGASFNGLNVLDNSSLPASDQNATTGGTATGTGALAFVSGFNATATGGSVNTITLTTQALINGGAADTSPTAAGGGGTGILDGGTNYTTVATTDSPGGVAAKTANTTINLLTLGSQLATANVAGATNSASTNAANEAQNLLAGVSTVLNKLTSYAAQIGTTQDAMTAASTFNTALTTNYSTGVSALVDADMNTSSTRLQALQTQEQLGIQSLSIANQNAQLILKLFP
jgi:flagellin